MDFAPLGTTGFGTFQPDLLVASTGIPLADSGNSGYYVDNGTVKNFFVEVGFKDSIAFMNKLWNEGLISQKAFTQDYSSYQSMGRGGGDENTALVGFTWGRVSLDRFGPTLESQYVAIPPLSSEEGVEPSWSCLLYTSRSDGVCENWRKQDFSLWRSSFGGIMLTHPTNMFWWNIPKAYNSLVAFFCIRAVKFMILKSS